MEGQPSYEDELAAFDQAVRQHPLVVVGAAAVADLVAAVRFARTSELGVGVQATGHGITVAADGGVLVNTTRMRTVRVDPQRRTAWIEAGVTWDVVIAAAEPFGLAPLCGAAPGVGAVSYCLGGGLGPLGRRFGFAADHVRQIDLITADGDLRHVTAESDPELFWGLRGGAGNFGIVAGVEIDLVAVGELYGGGLFFPGEARDAVFEAFLECTDRAPEELSLSVAVLTFPEVPALPPALRGRYCVHVRVAHLGPADEAERLIDPLRRAGHTLLDTVRPMPFRDMGTIHNDPVAPRPVHGRTLALRRLDRDTVRTLLEHAGPTATSMVELRQLGGALARPPAVANAVGHRSAAANLYTSAYPNPNGFAEPAVAQQRLLDDLVPWSDGGALLTFLAGAHTSTGDVEAAYDPDDFARLRALKAVWDPADTFRFTKNIPLPDATSSGHGC